MDFMDKDLRSNLTKAKKFMLKFEGMMDDPDNISELDGDYFLLAVEMGLFGIGALCEIEREYAEEVSYNKKDLKYLNNVLKVFYRVNKKIQAGYESQFTYKPSKKKKKGKKK